MRKNLQHIKIVKSEAGSQKLHGIRVYFFLATN